ncbi:unnamed protein product [Soboliphyme baturini]|uniref:alpha-glucosidase n=1 Tax=Soboliphyme baturini TaxID=241478 RepID=A0A3P8D8B8_9BILA|nr:unnamed protein product [Soboliphyme baturini]
MLFTRYLFSSLFLRFTTEAVISAIQINIVSPKYSCLTKEELQRYADDPFWKRLRMSLFILLWGIWLAMFVGAIVIVVISPKCPLKPTRSWWQKQMSYQIWTASFQDSDGDGVGDLQGIINRIPDLLRLGVQSLWLVPLLKSAKLNGYDIVNFTQIEPRIGTMEQFDDLLKKVHEKDMFLVMDYPLSITSSLHPWFSDSAARKAPFSNFYIWRKEAPNTYHYLHYPSNPNRPILNWSDYGLRGQMASGLKFWLDHGVDGFYLGFIEYMALKDSGKTVMRLRLGLKTRKKSLIVFCFRTGILLFTSLSEKSNVESLKASLVSEGSLNYVLNTELTTVDELCNAKCVYDHLNKIKAFHERFNETWPMWEIGNPYVSRLATRVGGIERGELFMLLLMMLPGSINTYYGDELGLLDYRVAMLWDGSLPNGGFSPASKAMVPLSNLSQAHFMVCAQYDEMYSPLQTFKRMANRRMRDDAFLYGAFELFPPDNDVLVISRNSLTNTAVRVNSCFLQ